MKKKLGFGLWLIVAAPWIQRDVLADALDDIGFRALTAQLGAAMPTGVGVRIDQIEASGSADPLSPIYRPDPTPSTFVNANVTFVDQTHGPNPAFSAHATGVALRFAGVASTSPGVAFVDNYEANDWINKVLFGSGTGVPVTGTGVLGNHSWVGSTTVPAQGATALVRLDRLIARDDYINVVGVTGSSAPLLSQAYNVISVTAPSLPIGGLSAALDGFYVAGRPLPHLVAPDDSTSNATPRVTSAVALLLGATPTHRLPAPTVKALLMAGAQRSTRSTSPVPSLVNYAVDTANGLDHRFGAGQFNIFNTYNLFAGGERASAEDGGSGAALSGYDFDPAFGGAAGANGSATYALGTSTSSGKLSATLAWNADILISGSGTVTATRLYNLNLQLLDTTGGGSTLIASSTSTIDNTENLWVDLQKGRSYALKVINAHGGNFSWPYAIAWRYAIDRDGDRLEDEIETGSCPASADADSDDDGIADGTEDTNRNGLVEAGETNPCNLDSDGDGVQDGTERGVATPSADPDGAGPLLGTNLAVFKPDANPASTTSPLLADTDGDGFSDGQEDPNGNGRVDAGESDPLVALSTPLTVNSADVPFVGPPGLAALATLLTGISAWRRDRRERRAGP